MWRVLIVEDDPHMREFFSGCVSACSELELAGCVGSVAAARQVLDEARAPIHVLLTDLGLPDGSGLDVIHHARQRHPECEALVISMFGDEDNVLASIEAGALGYIHKDASPADISHTILEMKAGASPISPMIARRVLARYREMQSFMPAAPVNPGKDAIKSEATADEKRLLSTREQDMLQLIARGFSYAEISRLESISVHTVQTHIKNTYAKLAVRSRGLPPLRIL